MSSSAVQPPVRMTELGATALLAIVQAADSRMGAVDADTARIRARVWWKILMDVDPAWATRYVEHAYSQLRDFSVTPAEIRAEWIRAMDVDELPEAREEVRTSGGRANPLVMDWIRASYAAVKGGGDVLPIPPGVGRLSKVADERARRCVFHALCACPHTHCRAGWEDAPHVVVDSMDRDHEAVKRCVMCSDALAMAEDRGLAKRPHAHGRRR